MASSRAARFGQIATTVRPAAAAAAPAGATRKYTVLLDAASADAFDEALLVLRRRTGKRVDKSQVVRELLALLTEDSALLEQVSDRLAQ